MNLLPFDMLYREIAKPSCDEWGTAMEAIQASLKLERTVNESLLNLHKAADSKVAFNVFIIYTLIILS